MIDQIDEKKISKMIYDVMAEALTDMVLPRFDKVEDDISSLKSEVGSLKGDVGSVKSEVSELKEKVDNLTQAVEILDNNMSGVKMRQTVVEKKLDGLVDTSLIIRTHEKRISKLEAAIAV